MQQTSRRSPGRQPARHASVVMARNGAIATSQPLATAAGLRVLQSGGNAIDAAVTAAAVLAVVEPTMNGVGGDLFAIVYSAKDKKVHGLNASGRAPAAATLEEFKKRGLQRIPLRGELSVSVPGRGGRLERAALEARHAHAWRRRSSRRSNTRATATPSARSSRTSGRASRRCWRATRRRPSAFLTNGKAPAPGDVVKNPKLAASLELIAKDGRDAFYKGAIAKAIADDMQRRNGLLTAKDLADHRSDWVEPLSTTYRGYQVLELPPNTQGIAALEMLNILEGFDLKSLGHNTAAYLHLMVEAKRIAFADRGAWLGDSPSTPPKALEQMLSKEYAAAAPQGNQHGQSGRRLQAARDRRAARRRAAATTRPAAATRSTSRRPTADGNVISLIQSIYETFGSGIVAGDTGIVLHNRGNLFSLDAGPSERARAGQAPVPHADSRDGAEGRRAVGLVRRDGRRHAGAGARAGAR